MSYATPRTVADLSECVFYHTMEIPGYGLIEGQWDLRGLEATYLGNIDLKQKRVLEIGTASGFLCFYMERQGAEVVAYDLSEEGDWDVMPVPGLDYAAQIQAWRKATREINNAFWLAHRAFGSRARVAYGTVYSIPDWIGRVDITTFGSVLLHCRDPFSALARAARLTDETIVVTDMAPVPEPSAPEMQFVPDLSSTVPVDPCTWWRLSPAIVERFLAILGFPHSAVTRFRAPWRERREGLFVVVAHRAGSNAALQAAAAQAEASAPKSHVTLPAKWRSWWRRGQ